MLSPERDLINWLHIRESESDISIVFHGPHSPVHMEQLTDDGAGSSQVELRDEKGNFITHDVTGRELGMPETHEVGGSELDNLIQTYLATLPATNRISVETIYNKLREDTLYGEFQVTGLREIENGESYDPAKIITAFALKLAQERKERLHRGEITLVAHTSLLYFLAQGDASKIPEKVQLIDEMCTALDINITYENITFGNEVFRSALPWMENPEMLLKMFPEKLESSGLCIDIEHLEKLGWQDEDIRDLLNRIRANPRQPNIVIHTDERSSVLDTDKKVLRDAYTAGTPVVYEPK